MLLSLCIPTFNRPGSIEILLDSIEKCSGYKDKIEIVVSDNSENVETEALIREFEGRSGFKVIYSRNEQNIGFTDNWRRCIQLSTGDYCLTSGDDDLISLDSLVRVIRILEKGENGILDAVILDSKVQGDSVVENYSVDMYCTNFRFFHTTFIGNIVFRREVFNTVLPKNVYTVYPHFEIFLLLLSRDNRVCLTSSSIVIDNHQNRPWVNKQVPYTAVDIPRLINECVEHLSISNKFRFLRLFVPSMLKYLFRYESYRSLLVGFDSGLRLSRARLCQLYFRIIILK